MRVAALYVDPGGPYCGRSDVDPWGEDRDARLYAGTLPVVAHPPCTRWGRLWSIWAATKGPHGEDGGCFAAALASVRRWGGVLEHPEASFAWAAFDLPRPHLHGQGWRHDLFDPGWTCSVDQSNYGHRAKKRTWLYYVGATPPPALDWSEGVGVHDVEHMGHRERRLTPGPFAEMLLDLARLSGRAAA